MIKTILVPATGDSGDPASLATALTVARAFAAHIDVLHVRVDPIDAALALTAEPGSTSAIAGLVGRLERDADRREAAVRRQFDDFCAREQVALADAPTAEARAGVSAQWHVERGDDARMIASSGMTSDLIVAGRGAEHDITNRGVLEATLLESGRPLLIPGLIPGAPESPAVVGGTVAIAWKPTPQCARAVAAAQPFLARARDVVVLAVAEGEGAGDADRLVRNLAWHGLRVRAELLHPGDQEPVETLLAAAGAKAGLLVMGGYGHSRLREWVFGGFTQRVLTHAPLPVLMAH